MHNAYLEKINSLRSENAPYATAVVTRRKKPSSGKPGDKAIITLDGNIHGWIGGGCTKGIVLKEALLSLEDKKPRVVCISPNEQTTTFDNTKLYAMTCQSGGELEVYIEPILPKPHIVIFGNSHIAVSLSNVAKAIDFRITHYMNKSVADEFQTNEAIRDIGNFKTGDVDLSAYVVVCTQGEGDLEALEKAVSTDSSYISFVSSRIKANSIFADLKNNGISIDKLKKIKTPAGIDINAKTHDEIAISILAEIIEHFRTAEDSLALEATGSGSPSIPNKDYYLNPVCNIPIQKSTAKHVVEYNGEKVYFCCDGCKVSFEKNPSEYIR